MASILKHKVGPTAYGMMGLTWRAAPPPLAQAFAAMDAALETGANMWNGGENYGPPERNSLHILNEYFTKYPEKASQVLICIKGAFNPTTHTPDGSPEGIRRSVDECLRVLDGKKSLDIFECARVDRSTPIEETMKALAECVKEGKIRGIGLSEVRAETIRRAHAVHPIAAVEVELSLWSTQILHNGIASTCAELGIPIVAYSPLSRGGLTSSFPKSREDMNPMLRMFPRFEEEALEVNMKLTAEVEKVARKKGCTTAQVALGWVRTLSGRNGLGTIIPLPGATTVERVRENNKIVTLTEEEMGELEEIIKKNKIVGNRYFAAVEHLSEG